MRYFKVVRKYLTQLAGVRQDLADLIRLEVEELRKYKDKDSQTGFPKQICQDCVCYSLRTSLRQLLDQ